jgi:hypothetical protein
MDLLLAYFIYCAVIAVCGGELVIRFCYHKRHNPDSKISQAR